MTEFERAIIIANSNQSVRTDLTSMISSKDLLIAADGGGKHCLDAGCTPQIIIGDLDSISKPELNELIALGTQVLVIVCRSVTAVYCSVNRLLYVSTPHIMPNTIY